MMLRLVRAELTKFRSVRGWVAGLTAGALVIVGLGVLTAYGTSMSCGNDACPAPPTGPGGGAVTDHFGYASQALDGDGTLTAHVASFTGTITYPPPNHDAIVPGLVPWAKAGIMVKDGTEPGASYAAVMLTPKHGVRMQYDFTEDRAGPSAASWLRLTRSGDTITGYASTDGTTWTRAGTATLHGLPSSVRIGLFVTSPSDITSADSPRGGHITQARFTQATAVFDRVDRGGSFSYTEVGDNGMKTDWEKFHQAPGLTRTGDTLTLTGSGDIAPVGQEAGAPLEHTLAGLLAGMLAVVVVAVLFMTTEYRRGLIRTTFTAMPARGRALGAKAMVIGGVTFAAALAGIGVAVPLTVHILRARDTIVLPTPFGTSVRMVIGTALMLALAAVLAYGIGAVLRRGIPAVTAAVVLLVLPYLLAVTSVLPTEAGDWLLRLTPAAGFAIQQTLGEYHQVYLPYTPAEGYFPLAPWAGLGVLAAWAAVVLGLAVLRVRRADA